jgi:lipopolysaccharide export system permease protein
MRFFSLVLFRYIARRYLVWLFGVLALLVAIIVLAESIELLRRAAGRDDIGFGLVAQMALLKTPATAQVVLPFAVLAAGMGAYWQLTRFHELVVARAAGVSVWQFLLPALGAVLIVSVLRVVAFDPVAAAMSGKFERLEGDYLGGSQLVAASVNGLWLRQVSEQRQSIVHAERLLPDSLALERVMVLDFTTDDRLVERIDADAAFLEGDRWRLANAWITAPNRPSVFEESYERAASLSFPEIVESFASARAVSFWRLPRYIELLEATGLPTLEHRLRYHRLLATPLLLVSMVALSAAFALRPARKGGVTLLIATGALTGFLLYFLSDVVHALGLSGTIPVVLAAWAPGGIVGMVGVALLLHLEDG